MEEERKLSDREWQAMVIAKYYMRIRIAAYRKAKTYGVPDFQPWSEDMAQEVFLRLIDCTEKKDLRHHPDITTWLFSTLDNVVGSNWQKRSNQEIAVADVWAQQQQGAYEMSIEEDLFPPGMKDGEREILYRHIVQGFSLKELAAMLGIAPAACRMRFSRAKERFRALKKKLKPPTESDSNRQDESDILQEGGAQNV